MTAVTDHKAMNRRDALRNLAAAGLLATVPRHLFAQRSAVESKRVESIVRYLEEHARPDGGYAWPDQPESHLTPTFAVIGCYHVLGELPPRREKLAEFVRTHHPHRLRKPERELRVFDFQQIQSLLWLGEEASEFKNKAQRWTEPSKYPVAYEQNGLPPFQLEVMALLCRELLGLPATDVAPGFRRFVRERRRTNGSFNHTPASDASDGHVMNTWWGLQALRALKQEISPRSETAGWLQKCQLGNGGFTHRPGADIGGVDDVAYTWAAARSLKLLDARPAESAACIAYLKSLRAGDGGFSDRPGWSSNPLATFYALDTLAALDALEQGLAESRIAGSSQKPIPDLPGGLKIFTIQIEAPGQGSPSDAVELARALRIHLWGAKNSKPGWIESAQALADERKVTVTFFAANEEYGTYASVPGLGTYSHVSDLFAPAGADIGPSLAGKEAMPWTQFRVKRHAALDRVGGRLFWQFGENEEFTRAVLDDSLERGGFAAISTFHFGNSDFLNSQPFLYRYRHRLPFIALQDAHGTEPWWWSDKLAGFRTLFLAREPTWSGWMNALQKDWVVAVRHDTVSGFKTWMHGGAPGTQDLVRRREAEWKWWREETGIERPLIASALLRPGDPFEAGCPETGAALRFRCAWECTVQGAPTRPLVELSGVTLDGARLEPKAVEKRDAQNRRADYYNAALFPQLAPGHHSVVTTARVLATGHEVNTTFEFQWDAAK